MEQLDSIQEAVKLVKKLISDEISWCENNKNESNQTQDFNNGFIHGLKQSIVIIDGFSSKTGFFDECLSEDQDK